MAARGARLFRRDSEGEAGSEQDDARDFPRGGVRDFDQHRRARFAANPLHALLQIHPDRRVAIDSGNDQPRRELGAGGGGIGDDALDDGACRFVAGAQDGTDAEELGRIAGHRCEGQGEKEKEERDWEAHEDAGCNGGRGGHRASETVNTCVLFVSRFVGHWRGGGEPSLVEGIAMTPSRLSFSRGRVLTRGLAFRLVCPLRHLSPPPP